MTGDKTDKNKGEIKFSPQLHRKGKKMDAFWFSQMALEDLHTGNIRCSELQRLDELLKELREYGAREGNKVEIVEQQRHVNFCQLDNGDVVPYTEMRSDKKEEDGVFTTYPDIIFLGYGKMHHQEPIADC